MVFYKVLSNYSDHNPILQWLFHLWKGFHHLIKHFNPKKKLVLSGVLALFTCSGAPPTSFFLGLKMFITMSHII